MRTERMISGFKSLGSWLILTVGIAGIPLLLSEIAFYIFERDMYKELMQLTSFFFSSTFGSLFIFKKDDLFKNDAYQFLLGVLWALVLGTFVLYVIVFFDDMQNIGLDDDAVVRFRSVVLAFGIPAILFSAVVQFLGGYHAVVSAGN